MPAERSKVILCTSTIPEEGKTTVASLLGMSLAHSGERVLLIDADMRKPALHRIFRLDNQAGLSNCLIGSSRWREVIHEIDQAPGLFVMTAGKTAPNPPILLNSSTVDGLLQELEMDFTKIIFDVPPSFHIVDGLILAKKVQGIVMIFRAGQVHQGAGKKMKEKIVLANGTLIGAIVN